MRNLWRKQSKTFQDYTVEDSKSLRLIAMVVYPFLLCGCDSHLFNPFHKVTDTVGGESAFVSSSKPLFTGAESVEMGVEWAVLSIFTTASRHDLPAPENRWSGGSSRPLEILSTPVAADTELCQALLGTLTAVTLC